MEYIITVKYTYGEIDMGDLKNIKLYLPDMDGTIYNHLRGVLNE